MEWWQIALIFLACVAVGVVIGALFSYLILRFVKKREATFMHDIASWFGRRRKAAALSDATMPPGNKPDKPRAAPVPPPMIEEHLKLVAPELLAEVKQNRRIANETLKDKLLAFQTQAWDAHQYEVDKLPAALHDDLEQAYTDIRLANSLAWLSSEFSRHTPSLNENYLKLRTSIAERLDRITQQMEQMAGAKVKT